MSRSPLDAGSPLDAWVAEHVMGWKWDEEAGAWATGGGYPQAKWSPSTPGEEMFELMAELQHVHDLYVHTRSFPAHNEVAIYNSYGDQLVVYSGQDTVPRALCLACQDAQAYLKKVSPVPWQSKR